MKFAVIGGDRRSAVLAMLLRRDGHRVCTYALEQADMGGEVGKTGCLQGAVYGADWVILPTPCERDGLIVSPLSSERVAMNELLSSLWDGQTLCGGGISRDTRLAAIGAGLRVADMLQRRDFAIGNAAITAEGAVSVLMRESDRTLCNSPVTVIGFGRIGKLLSLKLHALGASVTVAARGLSDRAMAIAAGMNACTLDALPVLLPSQQFIVNTVPAPVLDTETVALSPDTILLELASAPGGFDLAAARGRGLRAEAAPGLPGTYAPYSAAELLRSCIYAAINEEESE